MREPDTHDAPPRGAPPVHGPRPHHDGRSALLGERHSPVDGSCECRNRQVLMPAPPCHACPCCTAIRVLCYITPFSWRSPLSTLATALPSQNCRGRISTPFRLRLQVWRHHKGALCSANAVQMQAVSCKRSACVARMQPATDRHDPCTPNARPEHTADRAPPTYPADDPRRYGQHGLRVRRRLQGTRGGDLGRR